MATVRTFEGLVGEAVTADVTGWGFGWLEGRAAEERPPWGYVRLLSERLPEATAALDLDTRGGEVLAEALAAAEAAADEAAGLDVVDLRTARCRMEFQDIGALVWTLRKCVWWVPDFSVERYDDVLRGLDAQLRRGEPFVAHSSRTLFDARRRPR